MKKRSKKPVTANFNDPQKGFDTTSKRTVFSLLLIIVAVMVGTYFFISYKYGSVANMFLGETTESTTVEETPQIEIHPVEGKRNFLITVTSPGEKDLYNIFLVGINMSEGRTSILSVPVYAVGTSERTLAEEFKLGGVQQVEYTLERLLSIDFDGYFCATQNGYKYFLTEMGKTVRFDVPEDLQFSTTNYTVSLGAGERDLSFDTFVKLMLYDGWSGGVEATFTRQGSLLQALYEQYFRSPFITRDADKFTYKMKYIKTDISSEDYVNDLDALEFIAATDFKVTVLTPGGTFSGSGDTATFTFSQEGIEAVGAAFG